MADNKRGRVDSSDSSSQKRLKTHDLGPFHTGKSTDTKVLEKLALFPNAGDNFDATKTNQFLVELPPLLWERVIIGHFGMKELARSREVCKFFEPLWKDRFENNRLPRIRLSQQRQRKLEWSRKHHRGSGGVVKTKRQRTTLTYFTFMHTKFK